MAFSSARSGVAVLMFAGVLGCATVAAPRGPSPTPVQQPIEQARARPDPDDPLTWAKQLKDPSTRQEALDRLADMEVERARPAVPALIELYENTRRTEHLEALARYKDARSKSVLLGALEYSEDDFDRAAIAAGALGDMKAGDAVDSLITAAARPLPVMSRANFVRLTAIRALVQIGDRRAVPTLAQILTTPPEEQDFLLNFRAAQGLAELKDPSSVSALIKGLFMSGRGTSAFEPCRLALVRIGDPAVEPLIALLSRKAPGIEEVPGATRFKVAIVLGDLRARRAVPALQAAIAEKARGAEQSAMARALGQIATPAAVDTLAQVVRDGKMDPAVRASASEALYLTGDRRALPTLLEVAKSGYITMGRAKFSDLRGVAAVDFARLAGPEAFDQLSALASAERDTKGMFAAALDRTRVAVECGTNLDCYGKALLGESETRAEKAALAIGFSGDAEKGIPLLLAALKPLQSLTEQRFPVHQAILDALTRLGTKSCADCVAALNKHVEQDEKWARSPLARAMVNDMRVALAVIQNKE